jgi:uncharacterized protein YndB with AHSA1/START domain
VPTVTRRRTLAAAPERVWRVLARPERLAEWWPRVQRVEEATSSAWTTVLAAGAGGRALRADYTLLESEHPRRLSWRHEVEASPFARVLRSSVTDVELEPAAGGGTEVTISERLAARGFARLGGLQLRRATRRKLDGALDGLERLLAGEDGG